MIDIGRMGYVRVASTDLDAWRAFAEKVLGLAEGRGPSEGNLYYRIDEVSARLVVVPGDVDELSAIGLGGRRPRRPGGGARALKKAGVEFEEGTAEELAERRVQELIRFTDPFDNVFELFHGITYERAPSSRRTPRRSSPATRGWATSWSRSATTSRHCGSTRDVLGFRLRDSMCMPGEFVGKEPGIEGVAALPRHQPAPPLAGVPADAQPAQVRPHHARGRQARRRRPRARAGAQAQGAAVGDARPAHERRDGVVLRKSPGGFDIEFGTEGLQVDDAALGGPGVDRRLATGATSSAAESMGRDCPESDELSRRHGRRRRAAWPPPGADRLLPRRLPRLRVAPGETIPVDDEEAQRQARLFRDVLGRYASGRHGRHHDERRRAGRDDLPVVHERLARPAARGVPAGEAVAGLRRDPARRHVLRQLPGRRPGELSSQFASTRRRQVRRRRVVAQRRHRRAAARPGSSAMSTAPSTRSTRPATTTS